MHAQRLVLVLTIAACAACRSRSSGEEATAESALLVAADQKGAASAAPPTAAVAQPAAQPAALGQPAPDFELPDLDGKRVKLSDFKGKTVVLEWFNPGCPFVKASHTKGSLVDTASRYQAEGVVWLAINSGAPGKQGAGREANVAARDQYGMKHPILLDESGTVGKLYGAKTTPHMFVISPAGILVYRGAIDNSPDGEGESPKDDKLIKYVEEALAAVKEGRPVTHADTEPYGCSVKYAN